MPIILDHTIVGQDLTSLTIRKDRQYAGCRICGAIFQSRLATDTPDDRYTVNLEVQVAVETQNWRNQHNVRHSESEHVRFRATGLTFTPEAAHRLAPFGLVPIMDAHGGPYSDEIAAALLEAPRAPVDDVESTLKGLISVPGFSK